MNVQFVEKSKITPAIVFAVAAVLLAGPAQSASTWDIVNRGKFYTYSVQPDSYIDHWPVSINGQAVSSGTKLCDGLLGTRTSFNNWVCWNAKPVVITVDLGKVMAINYAYLHARSQTSSGVYYPNSLQLEKSFSTKE